MEFFSEDATVSLMYTIEIRKWLSEKVRSARKEYEDVPGYVISRRGVGGMKINFVEVRLRSFGERDEDGKGSQDATKGGRTGRRR